MSDPAADDALVTKYPGAPLWVKVFAAGFVTLVVVVLLVTVAGTALGLHTPMGPGHGAMSPGMSPHP
ncbi:MAG TPA: hypothetical protein VJQ09_02835 [Candidatus Limnocylindria bacterium]|nr:hypothetical protein [Candidatus Limnocylindria bacterium]